MCHKLQLNYTQTKNNCFGNYRHVSILYHVKHCLMGSIEEEVLHVMGLNEDSTRQKDSSGYLFHTIPESSFNNTIITI